jgi:hypothetical protein
MVEKRPQDLEGHSSVTTTQVDMTEFGHAEAHVKMLGSDISLIMKRLFHVKQFPLSCDCYQM